jgi:hypothetical protein
MAHSGERVTDMACTEDRLIVRLADRCSISMPLVWCPLLLHATPRERDNGEIAGAGFGSHGLARDGDLPLDRYSCGMGSCLGRRTLQLG